MIHQLLKGKWQRKAVFLASVPIIFAACTMWGPAYVEDAPEWLTASPMLGSWEPWPGENHPLAKILPDRLADKKQYDGYFRIVSYDPTSFFWMIEFSDGITSDLFIWLGVVQAGGSIDIPQLDPDVFEFDGRISNLDKGGPVVTNHSDDVMVSTDFPAIIRYERVEDADGYPCDSNEFPCYRFKIVFEDGQVLFDTRITSMYPWIKDNKRPSWLPKATYQTSEDTSDSYCELLTQGGDYVFHINVPHTKNILYSTLSQEEIDNQERRVLYKVYGTPSDIDLYYIEAHRNTRETVVFRFMDRNKDVLNEGTGWIIGSEDLDTW